MSETETFDIFRKMREIVRRYPKTKIISLKRRQYSIILPICITVGPIVLEIQASECAHTVEKSAKSGTRTHTKNFAVRRANQLYYDVNCTCEGKFLHYII